MGGKSSHFIPSNRPESGGANKDERLEKSGILEREKEDFAAAEQEKDEGKRARQADRAEPADEQQLEND